MSEYVRMTITLPKEVKAMVDDYNKRTKIPKSAIIANAITDFYTIEDERIEFLEYLEWRREKGKPLD